jgi:hypothetical protein
LSLEVAKKYIIAKSSLHGSLDAAAFSQKKFDLAAAGKSRWIVFSSTFKKEVDFFFTAARRNKSIFRYLQSRSAFATAKKNIFCRLFLSDESKVVVVRRHL